MPRKNNIILGINPLQIVSACTEKKLLILMLIFHFWTVMFISLTMEVFNDLALSEVSLTSFCDVYVSLCTLWDVVK